MLTKKRGLILITVGAFCFGLFLLKESGSGEAPKQMILPSQVKEGGASHGAELAVTPDQPKTVKKSQRDISSVSENDHDEAKHQSGIPHECLESLRLGADNKLPPVEISQTELMDIAEQGQAFEEEMADEFEHYIVSDDGQSMLDKRAITEDFQALVDASENPADEEIDVVDFAQ